MIDGEKIGVGVVTYKRPLLLRKALESLFSCGDIDTIIVVDDGGDLNPENFSEDTYDHWETNDTNLGVGKSKNKAIEYLLEQGCDHIFLIEDDIYVKDPTVFEKYIKASKASGIQHFNYSQHGMMNKTFDIRRSPNPRMSINYGEAEISFYPHCVGAFSYYSKKCLEIAGLIDEQYYNACEHVDHTYEIIKKGLHPSFWYFADIANSWEYLGDEEWSIERSTISSSPNHRQMMVDADRIFIAKHGHAPGHISLDSEQEFLRKIKAIKNNVVV